MNISDRLRVSIRHIRGRLVESVLVILATAVGVALVAAMAAFIRSYDRQTEYLLNHPAYRELVVEAVGSETVLSEPAVPYDPETTSDISLGYTDLGAALADTSLIAYGYLADREELSTRLPGAGRFRGGIPPAPAGAADRDTATDAQSGIDARSAPAGGTRPPGDDGTAANPLLDLRRQMQAAAQSGDGTPSFNLDQFFQTDPDVVTDLPLDSFAGRRVSAQFFNAYGLVAEQGSAFTDEDLESGNQVLVLGSDLARTLFPGGDAVGTRVRLNLQTYTVVGILESTGLTDATTGTPYDTMAFVPNTADRVNVGGTIIRLGRPTRTLRFAVTDSADLDGAEAELQAHFDAEYGTGAVHITAPLEEVQAERDKLGRILTVVMFLAAAGLFIASINLFNLMLMRVIKRTKGVGISRALGATRREIARQFLNESALMSFLGAAIGLAASPLVYAMLASALVVETPAMAAQGVEWLYLGAGALAAFLFSVAFGILPARQAARIDAALAIRTA